MDVVDKTSLIFAKTTRICENNKREVNNQSNLEIRKKNVIKVIKKYNVKIINILNDSDSEINKRIEKIYVINLAENTHKRNYIIALMAKYKINFTLVIVERISPEIFNTLYNHSAISIDEVGCCLSHLWCLYQILINKFNNAIIFEDDIILHKDFEKKLIDIYDKNPQTDFLLLGCHDFNFSNLNYNNVKEQLYRPDVNKFNEYNNLYGAHANLYSLKGAKRMFHIRISQIDFFDKEYMLMFNHFPNAYICYPNLVVTNITESNLGHERQLCSYVEHDYYNKCFINFNFNKYNFVYVNLLNHIKTIYSNDTYETITERYLNDCISDEHVSTVKQRLVMDFFTVNDILNIIKIGSS